MMRADATRRWQAHAGVVSNSSRAVQHVAWGGGSVGPMSTTLSFSSAWLIQLWGCQALRQAVRSRFLCTVA